MASSVSKANWAGVAGAVVTVATAAAARWFGWVEAPDATLVQEAIMNIVLAAGGALASWLAVYFAPKNT